MQKADKDTIKKHNKLLVLESLKRNMLSRTELAGITGLSNSTVSSLVAELMAEKLVFEKSIAASSGGRKPILLSINPGAAYAVLFKIAPHRIISAVVDLQLQVVYKDTAAFERCDQLTVEHVLSQSIEKIYVQQAGFAGRIVGAGVSVAGMVDHSAGVVLYSSILNLKDFDIGRLIKEKTGTNAYVFKDTDALLLGESYINGYRDGSCLYILVDTGVGLSYMRDGEILQFAKSGFEIGHVQLDPAGPVCNCGKRGCVEAYISQEAAQRGLVRAAGGNGRALVYPQNMTYAEIVAKAAQGDAPCMEVIRGQCDCLSRVVSMAVNLFAPDRVLIGGPLGSLELSARMNNMVKRSVLDIFSDVEVSMTKTGDKASFIGMSDRIFNSEIFHE